MVDQLDLLNDPEYGGPRDKAQIDAILAQPQGQSREMEEVIDAFLRDGSASAPSATAAS